MNPTLDCGKKPHRPKRPLTAYMAFMKKFLRAQCIKSKKEAMNAVRAGAKRWRNMSDAEKSKYGRSCAKGRMLYEQQRAEYLRYMKAFTAPPRPFGAFIANYSKDCKSRSKGLNYQQINREARLAWRSLPQEEKNKYRTAFYQQYDDFCRRMEETSQKSSGEFVAAANDACQPSTSASGSTPSNSQPSNSTEGFTDFERKKFRREKSRLRLQQKLERLQRQDRRSLISSTSQSHKDVEERGSLILEQDDSTSNKNNTADANNIAGAGASSKEKQDSSSQNANSSSSGSDRALRRRKAEAVHNNSHSKAKNIKLVPKSDNNSSRNSSVKAKAATDKKNQNQKQEPVRKRGRPRKT